jgi:uncharacterized protein (DUF1697 family)
MVIYSKSILSIACYNLLMQYIALLRGIGPGNPNMSNENLRLVFDKLGFKNVRTVISSGNVLFDHEDKKITSLENRIEQAISEQLGFHSSTIVRSRSDLEKIISHKPFPNDEHTAKNYLTVTFIKPTSPFPHKLPYTPKGKSYCFVDFFDNCVFSVIDTTAAKTPDLMTWLEKQFTKDITTRTWKTVLRIHQKWEQSDTKN